MLMMTACGKKEEVVQTAETEVVQADNRLEAIVAAGTIRIGVSTDYAPFAFPVQSDDGLALAGADVELGKYIAEGLGVNAEFCEMEFEECLTAVKEGSVDLLLLGMLPNAERKTLMDFTEVYYEPGKQVLLIQKKDKPVLIDKAAFGGKAIAAQYGTLQSQLVVEQFPESYLELTDDISGALMKLRMGSVDGVALDQNVAKEAAKEYSDLAESSVILDWEPKGIVGGVVKDQPELLGRINELLAKAAEEKLYFEWLEDAHKLAASMPAK